MMYLLCGNPCLLPGILVSRHFPLCYLSNSACFHDVYTIIFPLLASLMKSCGQFTQVMLAPLFIIHLGAVIVPKRQANGYHFLDVRCTGVSKFDCKLQHKMTLGNLGQ